MKSFTKKCSSSKRGLLLHLFTFIIVLTMLIGSLPVSAAKSSEIVVKTKKELVKALKTKSPATIVIKTNKKTILTIPALENSANKKLVMEAPNARALNKATFKAITLKSSVDFDERGKNNSLYIKGDGVKLTVSKGIETRKVSISANDVIVKVASDGNVGDIICNKKAAEITVAVEKNAEANITIKKQADLVVQGDKTANITIVPKAPNTKITTSASVDIVAEKNVDVVLEKGCGSVSVNSVEGASVETLTIAAESGELKIINNGEIGKVDVTGESKVDVEQNGSVGELNVEAAAQIRITGTSEEKLAVTVNPEAAGASIKSEVPVKVNAYADVDVQLEKGAENSAVTLKNEDAGVKLENNTDRKVTVTDSDGEKQTVKKGEDLTSDNYVGKPEETDNGTEGETSGTPSEDEAKKEEPKEEDKKDENKEEESKDDTTSPGGDEGGSPQGGNYISDPPKAEWGTPVYVWINDNTKITATLPCTNKVENDIVETVDVTITETTASTCNDNGSVVYTSEAFSRRDHIRRS